MKLSEIETEMELTQLEYDTQGYLSTNQADLLIKHMRLLIKSQKKLLQEKVEQEERKKKAFNYYTMMIHKLEKYYHTGNRRMNHKLLDQVSSLNVMLTKLGLLDEAQAYKNKALEERRNGE